MEQIITVTRISQPAPGKKQGAVFDENDQRWGVWPNDLGIFVVGGRYKIANWKTSMLGKTEYRTLQGDDVVYLGGNPVVPPPPNQPPRAAGYQPRPPSSGGGFDDLTRRRDIFICGALNNILNNGGVPSGPDGMPDGKALVTLVWRLRKVFDYTLGPHAQDPSVTTARVGREATPEEQASASLGYGRVDGNDVPARRQDMNDEIPF